MSDDSRAQQEWWESMTPEQREAYEDAIARDRAEREVYGRVLTADERTAILAWFADDANDFLNRT